MSRSYKKVPTAKDYSRGPNGTKSSKRFASKAVRHYKGDLSDGANYKRCFCSYNIFDYKYRCWDKDSYWYTQFKRK